MLWGAVQGGKGGQVRNAQDRLDNVVIYLTTRIQAVVTLINIVKSLIYALPSRKAAHI